MRIGGGKLDLCEHNLAKFSATIFFSYKSSHLRLDFGIVFELKLDS